MDLLIFDSIIKDPCIQGIIEKDNTSVLKCIINFAERQGVTRESIKEYVASFLANDDNILSELAAGGKNIGDDLLRLAKMDISQIYKKLYSIPIKYSPSENDTGFYEGYIASIKRLTEAKSPDELLGRIIEHYRSLGTGILAKYIAFKYDGELNGISSIDPITFDMLIGIEHQKKVLIENTEAFLKGRSARNVLLFGDRGTGKSSCVKALLNKFHQDGLRMIELSKEYVKDIPKLAKTLSGKPNKYIIFLDDLSFESQTNEYKALKTAMEGQLQAMPDNMLIYATSNRRHLIKETWSDRSGEEVHRNDFMQETLSLSERFGISLVFSSPNQKEYLRIVSEMLKRHGVEMTEELEKQAVIWQMNYSGRNGRCAKQFVSAIISKS